MDQGLGVWMGSSDPRVSLTRDAGVRKAGYLVGIVAPAEEATSGADLNVLPEWRGYGSSSQKLACSWPPHFGQ